MLTPRSIPGEVVSPRILPPRPTCYILVTPRAPNGWDCCSAACAFSGSLFGLELVPSKRRYLVPGERRDGAQSRPPALITLARALRRGADAIPRRLPRSGVRGITQTVGRF